VGDPGTFTVDKGTTTRAIIAAPEGDGQAAQAIELPADSHPGVRFDSRRVGFTSLRCGRMIGRLPKRSGRSVAPRP
jgi:hypothetical protein